jgi:Zn-dependent peptidase ImmA (M78 family)
MIWEPWDRAIDELCGEILMRLATDEPPVDALHAVRLLGCELAYDQSQMGRARQKMIEGQPAVLLKPDDRPERLQWATAHEIGEIFAWQICERTSASLEELPEAFREQLANRFASRFLLPTDWFQADLRMMGRDLFLLKERYRTASHELISRRLQDFQPEIIVTVIDQREISSRKNGFSRHPGGLMTAEREAIRESHESGRPYNSESSGVRMEVWPIHERSWKREILFTLHGITEESSEYEFDHSVGEI